MKLGVSLHRFSEKIEDFFILGVIDFRKACIYKSRNKKKMT